MVRAAWFLVPCAAWIVSTPACESAAQSGVSGGHARAGAAQGRALYAARCAACHGPDMEGIDDSPPLIGVRFDKEWRGKPADLFSKIKLSMPQDDPGSLSAAQAADIVAAILDANHVPSTPTAARARP